MSCKDKQIKLLEEMVEEYKASNIILTTANKELSDQLQNNIADIRRILVRDNERNQLLEDGLDRVLKEIVEITEYIRKCTINITGWKAILGISIVSAFSALGIVQLLTFLF